MRLPHELAWVKIRRVEASQVRRARRSHDFDLTAGQAQTAPAGLHCHVSAASPEGRGHGDEADRSAPLFKGCGVALVAAGVLMAAATLLHPSRETATTIIASEGRLVAAHMLYTLSWLLVLLGLPGLYVAERGTMRRLGLVGFLVAFSGTYLIAVTGNFGFLAPVLARQSPAVLDSITEYPPAVGINGLAAIAFMLGYALFGVAMTRMSTLPRLAGVLVAVGAPAHLLGFGMAQLVSTVLWPVAVLGAVSLGAGLAWPGFRLSQTGAAADRPSLPPSG